MNIQEKYSNAIIISVSSDIGTEMAKNVYGAYQQLFKIIPRTVIYIKLGKIIELHGGGHAVKSYIHIRDISRGELAAMEKGKIGEIYHFSPDKGLRLKMS